MPIFAAIAFCLFVLSFVYYFETSTSLFLLDGAFWTMMTAWATVMLAVVAWHQISAARQESTKERTLRTCMLYDTDPIIVKTSRRLGMARDDGRLAENPAPYQHDIVTLLNYFDAIAIGVHTELFDAEIVHDHMKPIMLQGCRHYFKKEFFKDHTSGDDLDGDFSNLLSLIKSWESADAGKQA